MQEQMPPDRSIRALDSMALLRVPAVLGSFRASLDFGGIDIAPDGSEIAFVWNKSGVYELYTVSVSPGSPPVALTTSARNHRAMRPRYSPDGSQMAFMRDVDGNEEFDLWLISRDGSHQRQLTRGSANREAFEWLPDGTRIVYRAHKNGHLGLWCVDVATGAESVLVQDVRDPGADHVTPDVSHDGRFVAYHSSAPDEPSNVLLYVVAVGGGSPRHLPTHEGKRARAILPRWAPDDSAIVFTTDERGRFEMAVLPVKDGDACGPVTYLTDEISDETALAWGRSGNILYRRSTDSAKQLRRYSPATGVDEPIVAGFGVCYSAAEAADGTVAYVWTTPVAPSELFVRPVSAPTWQVTHSMPDDIDSNDLIMPTRVRYPGADGWGIPALLYIPHQARSRDDSSNALPPAIVWAHGGGTWQHLLNWDPVPQWLATNGYVVLAVNARGSRGYGREFREANFHDWGGKDLEDHIKGADWLEREGIADGTRIGMYGSSGGGYLTSLALTRAPHRWAAGVTSCGMVSLKSFYYSTRVDLRGMLEAQIGSPEAYPELFEDRSPLTHIANIRAPLLVLHGAKDPRIPVTETEQMVRALQALGARHDFHVYPDEGHGFRDIGNQSDALRRVLSWFDTHLLPRSAGHNVSG